MKRMRMVLGGGFLMCLLAALFFYYFHGERKGHLSEITVENCGQETLCAQMVAEIIGLSRDMPPSYQEFDESIAEEKLKKLFFFKNVSVKKRNEHLVWVKFKERQPLVIVADLSNSLLDDEGMVIPFFPLYTPKCLPKLIVGFSSEQNDFWGEKISEEKLNCYKKIISLLGNERLITLDLERMERGSLTTRQVVLEVKRGHSSDLLRLSAKNYEKELNTYLQLSSFLKKEYNYIADLRFPEMVLLQTKS